MKLTCPNCFENELQEHNNVIYCPSKKDCLFKIFKQGNKFFITYRYDKNCLLFSSVKNAVKHYKMRVFQ